MSKMKSSSPATTEELKKAVQQCWDSDPMDYGSRETPGSREYFERIDQIFEQAHFFGQRQRPLLSGLIDYRALQGKTVLEVGCGLGSMLAELARAARMAVGIDLTNRAASLSHQRLNVFGLRGSTAQSDAEKLPFRDKSFDYVLSWGVIHHTPGTQQAISEIYRVLKPGGRIGIMLYHRNSINYYYHMLFKWGVIGGKLLRYGAQGILNLRTDKGDFGGTPLAKAYTKKEIAFMFRDFTDIRQELFGLKTEVDTIPIATLPLSKWLVPAGMRYRLLSKWGWFNWITARKEASRKTMQSRRPAIG